MTSSSDCTNCAEKPYHPCSIVHDKVLHRAEGIHVASGGERKKTRHRGFAQGSRTAIFGGGFPSLGECGPANAPDARVAWRVTWDRGVHAARSATPCARLARMPLRRRKGGVSYCPWVESSLLAA